MPTYAYACRSCGHRFDAVQSFSEPTLTECPVCAGPLRKEYGSIGVTFNGSGFYRTDSRAAATKRADAGASASGGDSGSSKGGESGSSKGGDSGSSKGGDPGSSKSGGSGSSSASSRSGAKSSPASSGS